MANENKIEIKEFCRNKTGAVLLFGCCILRKKENKITFWPEHRITDSQTIIGFVAAQLPQRSAYDVRLNIFDSWLVLRFIYVVIQSKLKVSSYNLNFLHNQLLQSAGRAESSSYCIFIILYVCVVLPVHFWPVWNRRCRRDL